MLRASLTLLLLSTIFFSCQKQETTKAPPNVIFILADDLGYHDLSCMGSDYYETPHIDRIAHEGMIFSSGYAACQVCSPSRASIMTGKYPARLGITDWIGALTGENWRKAKRYDKLLPAANNDHLPHEDTSLAEAMKAGGYRTFFSGKWHLGSEGSYPEDHGFDVNIAGWEKGSPMGGYYSPYKNPKIEDGDPGESLPIRLAQETVKFIQEHKDTSFFAFLSFYAVHGPIQTTREKWAKYRNKAEQKGLAESGYEMERNLPIRTVQDNPVYAGLVESMDDGVGLVLNCLKDLGLEENTIVIFTSDNGGVASGDAFSTTNIPLRGGKGYQWEGGIKEPYFIKVPWLEQKGSKSEVLVTGTDFYPTILDLVGLETNPAQHIDGLSLRPILEGKSIPERNLYWHYPHYGNQGGDPSSIVRQGDWKLIHYWEDGKKELYNLKTDPSEKQNVADQETERVTQLSQQLDDFLNETNARIPQKDPEYNAELDQERHQEIINKMLPRLEQQRKDFLSIDFDPGNNWWGSLKPLD